MARTPAVGAPAGSARGRERDGVCRAGVIRRACRCGFIKVHCLRNQDAQGVAAAVAASDGYGAARDDAVAGGSGRCAADQHAECGSGDWRHRSGVARACSVQSSVNCREAYRLLLLLLRLRLRLLSVRMTVECTEKSGLCAVSSIFAIGLPGCITR